MSEDGRWFRLFHSSFDPALGTHDKGAGDANRFCQAALFQKLHQPATLHFR
jgi:hypothetical protein